VLTVRHQDDQRRRYRANFDGPEVELSELTRAGEVRHLHAMRFVHGAFLCLCRDFKRHGDCRHAQGWRDCVQGYGA